MNRHALLGIVLIVSLACSTLSSHGAVILFVGGSLVGATDVDVNGTLYDVAFVDGTLASVFGSTLPSSFDFQSEALALAAADALLNQVFVGLVDDDPDITLGIADTVQSFTHIPYGFTTAGPPNSINARARNHEQEFLDSILSNILVPESFDSSAISPDGDRINWARFSDAASVPEPSSFALLGMGIIGLIGYRRRKRKQAA